MSIRNIGILTQDEKFDILSNRKYDIERTMLVIRGNMAVRSRLKLVLAEHNTARIRAGEEPRTVRDLAKEISLSPSVITGLTSGRARRVDFETLNKLCKVLGCQPGDLLVYTPDEGE